MESLLGPFGGSRGSAWNYKPNGTITQIVIAHSTSIESITFKHKTDNGLVQSSNKFGGNGGKVETINIINPSEYLTSISGTYGSDSFGTVVRSLRVATNLKTYGPFGVEQGTRFSSATTEQVVIVGFHGRSGLVLDAIGVYVKPKPLESLLIGPFGGSGGSAFNYMPNGPITQIVISLTRSIQSITFKHKTENGVVESSNKFGGDGGEIETVNINNPSEYLTSIDGTFGPDKGGIVVKSISFVTNLKTYGPFGTNEGTPFTTDRGEGDVIVGFHGRSGSLLDAIGVYVKPKKPESSLVGPFGGSRGSPWNYKPNGTIMQIVIAHSTSIESITFKHKTDNGLVESSDKFGGNGGKIDTININSPLEYLTSIRGTFGSDSYGIVVRSLRVVTNLKTYGPFGVEGGTPFSSETTEQVAIVGFHGRSGLVLDAIGVYVKPKPLVPVPVEVPVLVGPFGGSRGAEWSYKPNGTITQILIGHSTSIESITFKHDNGNGIIESSNKFGGNGGKIDTININNPLEYLTSISGTFGPDTFGIIVRSLLVVTNLKTYGPFGSKEGTPFSSATAEHGVIIGFHGRSGLVLDAIGVYVKPTPLVHECAPVGVGPWGGSGGNQWDYLPKGVIKKIVINHGQGIDSIMFKHDNGNGLVEDSKKFGGNGGNRTEISINSPLEYLTHISGSHDSVVKSLRFVTNLKTYGPYGSPGSGTPFALPIKEGATVVGFYGRSGNLLDAIAFYLKPK